MVARGLVAAFVAYLLGTSPGVADPRVLDIKSYTSPSGRYVLEVDPGEIYGRGPGTYRLMRDHEEVWSKTLPFTFFESLVLDDGTSVGYAYENGEEGFALSGDADAGAGALHVAILDPKGGVRLDKTTPRNFSRRLHSPAEPLVQGILLSPKQDQFTVCFLVGGETDFWKTYRSSTGKLVSQFDVRKTCAAPPEAHFLQAAETIKDTPLTLLQWSGYGAKSGQRQIFMLITPEGRRAWTQDVSAEYPFRGDTNADEAYRVAQQTLHAILDVTQPGRFELWFAGDALRVTFSVTRDSKSKTGWRVEEAGRTLYRPVPAEETSLAAPENRPLPLLGDFKLEDHELAATGPIHDVTSFAFDAEGHIGLIQGSGEEAGGTFTLLDQTGHVVAEVPLPRDAYGEKIGNVSAAPVSPGRWVLVASEDGQEERAWGWWFDVSEKRLGKQFPMVCPFITRLAGNGNGGFVVLAKRRSDRIRTDELHGFDRQGSHLWTVTSQGDGPEALFSPEDVTVTGRGEVAVLGKIRDVIQCYDRDGKYLRTVDLKASWGREPRYLVGLTTEVEGGFVVHDFRGDPPFVRMKADGTVRQLLRPRHPNGRIVDAATGLQVAPDGRIWACDQQALFRLDEQGVVDLTLGRNPQPDELVKIAGIAADRRGRLHVVDERTGAIHIYDADGKKLRICRPDAGDFAENVSWPHLAVADDGSVSLQVGNSDKPAVLQFDPAGHRVGFKALKIEESQKWYAQPGTKNMLVTVYHFAGLIDSNEGVLKNIDRKADRRWLDYISGVAFASDGSFAILSEKLGSLGTDSAITLFSAEGNPTQTFPLPKGMASLLGYNGTHFVLRRDKTIEIYDQHAKPVQAFPTPVGYEWGFVLSREGRELWCLDYSSRTVQRFAMP